jgi:phage-related protein
MDPRVKIVPARFFRTASGAEPVKAWLKDLRKEDRQSIGTDIRTVEFGWPIGMPVCRSITGHKSLWEIRTKITDGIARVIFMIHDGEMILLHGFMKKTQKTPQSDLAVAAKRKKEYEQYGR